MSYDNEIELADTISAILVSRKGVKVSPIKLQKIIGNHRTLAEIRDVLEQIVARNYYIKREQSEEEVYYYFRLSKKTTHFIEKYANYFREELREFSFNTSEGRNRLLREKALPLSRLRRLYPKIKGTFIRSSTLRNYLQSLVELHILHRTSHETYYINIDFMESIKDLDKIIELEEFWNSAFNYKDLLEFSVHGLEFDSGKYLPTEYTRLTREEGWADKRTLKSKEFSIPSGNLKVMIYSNAEDQSMHRVRITYKGELVARNKASNRKIRGKFSINRNMFESFLGQVEMILYSLKDRNEIGFTHEDFKDFVVAAIGFNIDVGKEGLRKRVEKKRFYFQKAPSFKDFTHNYVLRYYEYEDRINQRQMARVLDAHIEKPDSFNINGMLDALSYTGENMINETILSHRILHKLEDQAQILDILRQNDVRFVDLLSQSTRDILSQVNGLQALMVDSFATVTNRIVTNRNAIGDVQSNLALTRAEILKKCDIIQEYIVESYHSDLEHVRIDLMKEISELEVRLTDSFTQLTTQINNDLATQIQENHDVLTDTLKETQNTLTQEILTTQKVFLNQMHLKTDAHTSQIESHMQSFEETLVQSTNAITENQKQLASSLILLKEEQSSQFDKETEDLQTVKDSLFGMEFQVSAMYDDLQSHNRKITDYSHYVENSLQAHSQTEAQLSDNLLMLTDIASSSAEDMKTYNLLLREMSQNQSQILQIMEKQQEMERKSKFSYKLKQFFSRISESFSKSKKNNKK